jgi:hypothetical protein
MNIQPLLDYAHPVTIGARLLSPDAVAWLLWESSSRGLSTLRQLDMPPMHIQTLTVKWWTSTPESLRLGCAEWLLDALRDCTANLYRFWQCVVQRMRPYDFYFLDPRLVSIEFRGAGRRRRHRFADN